MVLYTIPFHSGHSQLHVAQVVAVALVVVVVEEETKKKWLTFRSSLLMALLARTKWMEKLVQVCEIREERERERKRKERERERD